MALSKEQIRGLTERPLLAIMATIYSDGSPQAIPVWYEYDGKYFIVTTAKGRVKEKNILRDPRVTLCIADTSAPSLAPLTVRGKAEVIEEGAAEATRRLAVRYLGPEKGLERAEALNEDPRVIIRIKPEKFL